MISSYYHVFICTDVQSLNEFFDLSSWSYTENCFLSFPPHYYSAASSVHCPLGTETERLKFPVTWQFISGCEQLPEYTKPYFSAILCFSCHWQKCNFLASQWSHAGNETRRLDCVQLSHNRDWVKEYKIDELEWDSWVWAESQGGICVSGCISTVSTS